MKINQFPDFSSGRVVVAGDVMLDRYWHGDTSRISPEAPVPVVKVEEIEERPGGAGNVALNIAALGGVADLVGITGRDEAADALIRSLLEHAVTCHFEALDNLPTITKLRVMSRHQQLIRLDFENGFADHGQKGLQVRFGEVLSGCDVVVLSDYGKGTLSTIGELISAARAAEKVVIVDPKGRDFRSYRGATLITPNVTEFEGVVGVCHDESELITRGEALRQELELQALLITRSEKGMTLLQSGCAPVHMPTRARDVYDVTGAGDTVVSVVAASLAAGWSLADATALANVAAGVVVGKMGTATVSVAEMSRAMCEIDQVERGVVSEERLMALVQEVKAHQEKVILTNGCFDILHAGHVTYLEQAAALGDRLVVAVNSDDSVRRLKGEERPVNSIERRMRVLAALDCVDWVVAFSEDTPTRLICNLLPDLLVKGGDNDPDQIPGGDCVRSAGGGVQVLSYVDNVSTTGLIASIRESEGRG